LEVKRGDRNRPAGSLSASFLTAWLEQGRWGTVIENVRSAGVTQPLGVDSHDYASSLRLTDGHADRPAVQDSRFGTGRPALRRRADAPRLINFDRAAAGSDGPRLTALAEHG
jgi:hypothetical protein